jgi:hypothetical protein
MIVNQQSIEERAKLLFKDDERMQQKWLDAVAKTRQSKRGWILDKQIKRQEKD